MSNSPPISLAAEGYTRVTPWIISPSSADLIAFLSEVFEAEEVPNSRITNAEGLIIHAVVKLGNALIMLFDSRKDWPATAAYLNVYVRDAEQTFQKALAAGARPVTSITPLWFGEKVGRILDPWGNLWWISQRTEEIDFTQPQAIAQRASTPEAIAGIAYIQSSLDEALKIQKRFLEKRPH